MALKVALIGAGKMAGALADGLVGRMLVGVANRSPRRLDAFVAAHKGVRRFASYREAVKGADVVIIAVKPDGVLSVIDEILETLAIGKTIVSVAAGLPLDALEAALPKSVGVVRAMPNLASAVRAGATGLYGARTAQARKAVENVFSAVGRIYWCDSDAAIDSLTAVSGSGIAYVLVWLEALADAAVRLGMERARAIDLSATTIAGAAALVHSTRRHPATLRDEVASPGGTTIAGLTAMEAAGVRGAIYAAVEAAYLRARERSGTFRPSEGGLK
ncbi:MAG: pyrroline-5-carboxylate reductase [Deltaproteobacteria bacterium]|nr:pyrroline-5-carboxylate reductase [Deltaproteobacteria bacterium]